MFQRGIHTIFRVREKVLGKPGLQEKTSTKCDFRRIFPTRVRCWCGHVKEEGCCDPSPSHPYHAASQGLPRMPPALTTALTKQFPPARQPYRAPPMCCHFLGLAICYLPRMICLGRHDRKERESALQFRTGHLRPLLSVGIHRRRKDRSSQPMIAQRQVGISTAIRIRTLGRVHGLGVCRNGALRYWSFCSSYQSNLHNSCHIYTK